ncbi:MAG: hypothetical protein LBK82_13845 [Planctomycetaceae bacterium]|jgi:hypothetical protein|nr:hypothetical protein [Planctomycetaceae bacterium]
MKEPTVGLEMQIVRLAKRETPERQFYSPMMFNEKCVAIAKFIHENAQQIERDNPAFAFLSSIADEIYVPFFLVRYEDAMEWFYVTPGNTYAHELLFEPVYLSKSELLEMFDRCRYLYKY